MAHAQKPDFVFRLKGQVHLNRRGRQFSRLMAAEVRASAVVMLDTPCSEVVCRVLATHSIRQVPLHFPSRASPCAIRFETQSTMSMSLYNLYSFCHNSVFWDRVNHTSNMEEKEFLSGLSSLGPWMWVPVTTAWHVLRLRMEERPPIWRVAVNKLNKQPRTADEGWSSSLGVGWGANNPSP